METEHIKQNQNNQPTNTQEELNMNNIIHAHFVSIHLPEQLQQKYENHMLYVSQDNTIRRSYDTYLDDNKQKVIRTDHTGKYIYKISDKIQIIWITTEGQYFITTYLPKQKVIDTIPGSYGSNYQQAYYKDYLRTYLLSGILTQLPLPKNSTNKQILDTMIKERDNVTYQFIKKQYENKGYINYNYYPVKLQEEKDLPEDPQ